MVLLAIVLVEEAQVGVTARGKGCVTFGRVLAALFARVLRLCTAPFSGVGVVIYIPFALAEVEDTI